jgi:hypothetical protein
MYWIMGDCMQNVHFAVHNPAAEQGCRFDSGGLGKGGLLIIGQFMLPCSFLFSTPQI